MILEVVAILMVEMLAGCTEEGAPVDPEVPVATVQLDRAGVDLALGDTVRLAATARGAQGQPLQGRTLTWASDRTDVATVDQGGLVTARGGGTARISATAEGKRGEAEARVESPAPATPELTSLQPASIQAGWGSFTLTVRGAGFAAGSRVRWAGLPLETHFVDATELRAGVSGSLLSLPATVSLTVEGPPPGSAVSNPLPFVIHERAASSIQLLVSGNAMFVQSALALDAVALDGLGQVITPKTITWTSSDTMVARVQGGHLFGRATGTIQLTATAVPVSVGMTLQVVAPPPADVAFGASPQGLTTLYARSLATGAIWAVRPPGSLAREAAVTADGSRIAFVGLDAGGDPDIYVMDRDGTGLQRLTASPGIDDQPAWSPDGQWIAFRSFRDGKSDVWVMRSDGTGLRNLTHAPVFLPEEYNDGPTWSPDGQRIAFSRGFGIGQALYTARPDGTALEQLVTGAGVHLSEPAWSPDGQLLAYVRRDLSNGARRLAIASASTGVEVPHWTGDPIDPRSPTWLGDQWIALAARELAFNTTRTLVLVRLGSGQRVVPLSPDLGAISDPAAVPRP